MNELIARAKSVIKLTDKVGNTIDVTIPKGGDIIDGINWMLPFCGITEKVYLGEPQSEWVSVDDRLPNYGEPVKGSVSKVVGNIHESK